MWTLVDLRHSFKMQKFLEKSVVSKPNYYWMGFTFKEKRGGRVVCQLTYTISLWKRIQIPLGTYHIYKLPLQMAAKSKPLLNSKPFHLEYLDRFSSCLSTCRCSKYKIYSKLVLPLLCPHHRRQLPESYFPFQGTISYIIKVTVKIQWHYVQMYCAAPLVRPLIARVTVVNSQRAVSAQTCLRRYSFPLSVRWMVSFDFCMLSSAMQQIFTDEWVMYTVQFHKWQQAVALVQGPWSMTIRQQAAHRIGWKHRRLPSVIRPLVPC